jgi:hypothetical protein
LIQRKYDVSRTVKIVGENKKAETLTFKGADLTSIDVRVQEGTMSQRSKAAQQDFILKLVQYKLLDASADKEWILKALELGITDSVYDEYDIDINQAQKENDKWAVGDMSPEVLDFYNHEVHVKEHNKFRKGETYDSMPPEMQNAINAHVQLHLTSIMQKILSAPAAQPQQPQTGTLPNNP